MEATRCCTAESQTDLFMFVPIYSNLFHPSRVGWCDFKRCTAAPVPGWSLGTSVSTSNTVESLRWFLMFLAVRHRVSQLFPIQSQVASSAPSVIYLRLRSPRRSTALYPSSTQRRAQRPRYSRAGAQVGHKSALYYSVFGMWDDPEIYSYTRNTCLLDHGSWNEACLVWRLLCVWTGPQHKEALVQQRCSLPRELGVCFTLCLPTVHGFLWIFVMGKISLKWTFVEQADVEEAPFESIWWFSFSFSSTAAII